MQRIENQYVISLAKTGIGLEPVKGSGVILTGDETIESSELKMNLEDHRQFLKYLLALEPASITPSQIEGLTTVVASLQEQLAEHYQIEKPDPHATELLTSLKEIIEAYWKLDPAGTNGLTESVRKLSVYSAAAQVDS